MVRGLLCYTKKTARIHADLSLPPKQLPLGLLSAAQGHPMLVELKNGETLNGHLVQCDTWMNLTLKEVVQTNAVCLLLSTQSPLCHNARPTTNFSISLFFRTATASCAYQKST